MWIHFLFFGIGIAFTFIVGWIIFYVVMRLDEGEGIYVGGERSKRLKHLAVTKVFIQKSIERRFGGDLSGGFDYEVNEKGQIHKFLGPAVTTARGKGYYFINDAIMTEDEYWRTLLKVSKGSCEEGEILAHMLTKGIRTPK